MPRPEVLTVTPESSRYQESVLEAERRRDGAAGLLRRTPPARPLPSFPLPASGGTRPPGQSGWSSSLLTGSAIFSCPPPRTSGGNKPTPQVPSSREKRRPIARPPASGGPGSASYHLLSFGKMLNLPAPQFLVCKMGMTGRNRGVWRRVSDFQRVVSMASDPA